MNLKDKLEIFIVTYNRKEFLIKTLEQLFAVDSPVRDLNITVLNNNSDDGTTEILNEYQEKFSNLIHIKHNKNIGGNDNIARAYELAKKEYVWLLGDNDKYSWHVWNEIENAIENNYDVIFTRKIDETIADIYYKASLISACIYKTKNITSTVLANAYDNIRFLFPHLALCAKNINDNNRFYNPSEDIVYIGVNPDFATTYHRGLDFDDIPKTKFNILWSVGYITSIELIKDRKKQIEIINGLRHFHKSLYDLFKTIVILNNVHRNGYFYNYQQIFRFLNFEQKIKFILAFLRINLSLKNYKYSFIREKESWFEYFNVINEQKYIDKLAKKYKNKKILLYGAGLVSDVLFENFDMSKLNIVGISDKRFEGFNEEKYFEIKTYKPDEIKDLDFDILLVALKNYKFMKSILKKNGCNKKIVSIINKSKYVLGV